MTETAMMLVSGFFYGFLLFAEILWEIGPVVVEGGVVEWAASLEVEDGVSHCEERKGYNRHNVKKFTENETRSGNLKNHMNTNWISKARMDTN